MKIFIMGKSLERGDQDSVEWGTAVVPVPTALAHWIFEYCSASSMLLLPVLLLVALASSVFVLSRLQQKIERLLNHHTRKLNKTTTATMPTTIMASDNVGISCAEFEKISKRIE